MLFSAYDSGALRLLSAAFSDAMSSVKANGGVLSEADRKRVAENLMKAVDLGECNSAALKRIAFRGVFVSAGNN